MQKMKRTLKDLNLRSEKTDHISEIIQLEKLAESMQTGYRLKLRILALLKNARKSNRVDTSGETRVILKRARELLNTYFEGMEE